MLEAAEAASEPARRRLAPTRARRRRRVLVQRRRRIQRRGARRRGRHRDRGDRQSGHRRLARLDGDHGRRDAGHPGGERPRDRRRHRVDRLFDADRRQPHHLRRRDGGGAGGREGHRRPEGARGQDLEHRRTMSSGGPARRTASTRTKGDFAAADAEGPRRPIGPHRRANLGRGVPERARRRPRLRGARVRRRGRPGDRPRHRAALHRRRRTSAARSTRAYVEGQLQGGARRASAGR